MMDTFKPISISQVQNRMTEMSSAMTELDGLQKNKKLLEDWIHSQESGVAEMRSRPAKFRPEAAQMELNQATDLRQVIMEKRSVWEELDMKLQGLGADPDIKINADLDTLDEHVRKFGDLNNEHLQIWND